MNRIEALESRKLMASANLVGDVLIVRGDVQAGNTINITNNVNGTDLDVSIVYTPAGQAQQSLNQSFAKSSIALLKVRGGIRADTISIGTDQSPVSINSRINGVSGADTINGGAGTDRIAGGKGNDSINGNGGNDRIHGELGSDTINGGDGDDVLWGGRGDDSMNGGTGDDVLGGVLGTNTLIGGGDNDTFVIKSGGQSQATDFNSADDLYKIIGTGQGDVITPTTI